MNTLIRTTSIFCALASTACDAEQVEQENDEDIAHPEVSFRSAPASCMALTHARYANLLESIDDAIALAQTDVANHGTTGAYPVAPQYSLNALEAARDDAEAKMDLFDSWPTVYAGVAYGLRFREVQERMWYAGHWANISAVYHLSEEAREVHALTEEITDQANALRTDAGRCYMDRYFSTPSP